MSKTFNPQFAELLSEAFSRIQIRPAVVTQEHIDEAIRSAQLLLVEFNNHGVSQYQLQPEAIALNTATATYNLAVGTLDVWSAILSRSGQDIPVWPMGRVDYQRIPNKTNPGRVFNYFVDKDKTGNTPRTITFWPFPENSTDIVNLWSWVRADDQVNLAQAAPIAYEWFDAYAAGLAARMARKYAPTLVEALRTEAGEAFRAARQADRERAPTRFRMRGYSRPRGL